MEYLQEITLELNSNTAYTTVGAKQGDSGSRKILVHLTENGADYTIPAGTSVYFRFRKPDGKAIVNTATVEDNAISIVLTAQTLAVAGRGYGDITLQSGSTILSTVSFILIIMASPQVSNEIVSSNEFTYLNTVVGDATNTIYEAEAWAVGTRGGVQVISTDVFTPSFGYTPIDPEHPIPSEQLLIESVEVDQEKFMEQVGSTLGLTRTYVFTFREDHKWWLKATIVNGASTSESDSEIINNIRNDYGISVTCRGGTSEPQPGEWVQVFIQEADNTAQNNAKYYAEQAAEQAANVVRYIEQPDLRSNPSAQEIARINISAQASGDYIINPSEKSNGQYLTYNGNNWDATTLPTYILEPVEKDEGQFLAYSTDGWYASMPTPVQIGAMPSILTSDFYGTAEQKPENPQVGQIFFVYSGD